ncbi:uncharacterized protein LOC131993852 [Centropristis striata]|uniref:uncharacterized protein LOC131993852 n=1 Tax=Centropristis striata TaxID=184440 RepID=UPI0027DEB0DD|nr:uncharacterized protein LOC131993852 [Centropristis striata]
MCPFDTLIDTYGMDSSINYESAAHHKAGLPENNCWNMTTIKIFPNLGFKFRHSAEDLLIMSLTFGDVIRVQKIVNHGVAHGEVTYSNVHDAAVALNKLKDIKCFLVSLINPWETSKDERSEDPWQRPPCLQQDMFKEQQSKRRPSLLDTPYPPAYSQSVCLRISHLPKLLEERYQLLSLLPISTTDVKLKKKYILVTLPDISIAGRLIASLDDVFTDSRRLKISFL